MNKPFVTTVVGSMPKPSWLMEQIPLNAEGKQVHGKEQSGSFQAMYWKKHWMTLQDSHFTTKKMRVLKL